MLLYAKKALFLVSVQTVLTKIHESYLGKTFSFFFNLRGVVLCSEFPFFFIDMVERWLNCRDVVI